MKLKEAIDMPTLYVLVGVPGSGKSTTVKKLQSSNPDTVVVCPDEYRKKLGGTYNYFKQDKSIWGNLCPTDVNDALSKGKNVIFDATNVSEKRRKSILQWAKVPTKKIAVVADVDVATAKKQNKMRDPDKVVPDHVIDNMAKSFTYPTESEGFDEILNANEI